MISWLSLEVRKVANVSFDEIFASLNLAEIFSGADGLQGMADIARPPVPELSDSFNRQLVGA
jgi:hypothetical protein